MQKPSTQSSKMIEIIAGPNGSGKSTFAESYFLKTQKQSYFINPDAIAAGLSPLSVELLKGKAK